MELYWRGWHFPDEPLNWLSVVTYGACIKSTAVFIVRDCMQELARISPSARGCFFVDDSEEEIFFKWQFDERGNFVEVRQRERAIPEPDFDVVTTCDC